MRTFLILIVCVICVAAVTGQNTSSLKRVCYYTNWSQYRPGEGRFWPEDIDYSLCTHVVYAFGRLVGNTLTPSESNDDGPGGLYERFNYQIKNNTTDVKTLLGVVGANFTTMLATVGDRAAFITGAITYLRDRNFDGINLDFPAPGSFYKDHFATLVQELKAAIDEEGANNAQDTLVVSVTLSARQVDIDSSYNVSVINEYADFINLITYDLWGPWDGTTGHHSPVYQRTGQSEFTSKLNWQWVTDYFIQQGASKEKLHPGLALFARSFTLVDPIASGYDMPTSGPGQAGSWTATAGQYSFYEVCHDFQLSNATRVWNDEHKVPYAYRDTQWVAFDDTESAEYKARWATENGFGGVMVFAYDMDDFGDMCGLGKYPLMTAIMNNIGLCINGTVCTP